MQIFRNFPNRVTTQKNLIWTAVCFRRLVHRIKICLEHKAIMSRSILVSRKWSVAHLLVPRCPLNNKMLPCTIAVAMTAANTEVLRVMNSPQTDSEYYVPLIYKQAVCVLLASRYMVTISKKIYTDGTHSVQKYLTWDFQSGFVIMNFWIGKLLLKLKFHQPRKFALRENNSLVIHITQPIAT